MPQTTKTDQLLEATLHRFAGDPVRVDAIERTRRFKRSWIELAETLTRIRDQESYLGWGFSKFSDYTSKELHLRGATVDKLCASFGFLKANAPRLARAEPSEDTAHEPPSLRAINFVQRAEKRGALDERTMAEMKRALFEEGAQAPVLSKRYKEVAFPVAEADKNARAKSAVLSAARRLADAVAEPAAGVPDELAERIEVLVGELIEALDGEATESN